jgi:pimeloyl-ACP methyl ester carboxylesterase
MPTIDANGLTMAYEVDGAGPPLVLLHNATGSGRDTFVSILPLVARGFRAYAPDARGHGGTRWDHATSWTTTDLADDVIAFADALGLGTFHLFGYSMGAMTALHVATRIPERLRTLVVVSITPERDPRRSVGRVAMDPDRIERHEPGWARQLAARHDPVQGSGGWQRVNRAIIADLDGQPLLTPRELRSIDAPALVAVGDRDAFVPVDHALALARQVRAGRLLVMPGVSHDAIAEGGAVLHAALDAFYRATDDIARQRG